MEKIITVKGIERLAQGTKNNKTWVMYKVIDQEDVEYKIFDALSLGAPYHISYSEEPRKPFVAKKGPEAGKMITPKGVDRFIKSFEPVDTPPVPVEKTSPTSVASLQTTDTLSLRVSDLELRVKALEEANQAEF